MKRIALQLSLAAAFACLLLSSLRAGPIEFPANEAGRRAAAYIAAFNDPDEAVLAAFLENNVAPDALARLPLERRMEMLRSVRADAGSLEIRKVREAGDGGITAVARGSKGAWLELRFLFEAREPRMLLGVRFELLDEPPDLDAPDSPISEKELAGELSKYLEDRAARDQFSGAVLVAKGASILFRKAYGSASVEYAVPNREDTRFNVGSINKFFTRIAIEQLAGAGRLSYDDPIEKFLPGYPNRAAAAAVSVRHLVDMTSGIGDFFGERYDRTPKNEIRALEDYLPFFAAEPLEFTPGEGERYSNGGYVVLGLIVEKASGQSYFDYVRDHICVPAGMTGTEHLEADVPAPNVASGYTRNWDGGAHPDSPRRNNIYTRPCRGSSAGGGYSTADDLLKLVLALEAGKLSAPETARMVTERGIAIAGGAPGISAYLETRPASGHTIVVLSNYDPPAAVSTGRGIGGILNRLQ